MDNNYITLSQKDKTEKTASDFDLWVLLHQTRDALSRAREMELAQYKITKVQASVLFMLLTQNKKVALSDISKWILREPHSVSSLITRMEKNGLVKKIKEPDDDRIKVVLTEKGQRTYSQITWRSVEMVFTSLTADEKAKLQSSLKKLRTKARSLMGLDYKPPFLP